MRIEVVTLFPALVEAGLAAGVLGRAVATGRIGVGLENPRSHADDAHRTVDDRPFGGGPGMVLKPEPLAKAIAATRSRLPAGAPVIGLAAHGTPFDQAMAQKDAAEWKQIFAKHEVIWSPVPDSARIPADPQMAANGVFVEIEGTSLKTVANPITLEGVAKTTPKLAPKVGEHTEEILRELE